MLKKLAMVEQCCLHVVNCQNFLLHSSLTALTSLSLSLAEDSLLSQLC